MLTTKKRFTYCMVLLSSLWLFACSDDNGDGNEGEEQDTADTDNDPDSEVDDRSQFEVDENIEDIAAAIVEETASANPGDTTVVYNLVWDAAFFQTIRQGFQVAAQEIGFNSDIVTIDGGWPPTGSLAHMDFTAEGADAYVSHWAGGVYEDNAEVPWFTIEPGTDVGPELYVAGVTSDNDGIAQLLAELMVDALDGATSGTIAVYGSADGPGYERGAGVKSILEGHGFTIVGAPDDETADDAEKVLTKLDEDFTANPDIIGVMGMLGFHGGAIGAWLQENGFSAGEVPVVCTDFEAETQEHIATGYVSATTVQRQYWWGYLAAYVAFASAVLDESALDAILAPYADENNVVTTKFDTVTPENGEEYLEFLADIGVME